MVYGKIDEGILGSLKVQKFKGLKVQREISDFRTNKTCFGQLTMVKWKKE